MDASSQSLDAALRSYGAHCNAAEHQSWFEACFVALQECRDIGYLRTVCERGIALEVPTRLCFAAHVQILSLEEASPKDWLAFSYFLSLFYEEFDAWAAAISRHHGGS
jgi:hypothetical protein